MIQVEAPIHLPRLCRSSVPAPICWYLDIKQQVKNFTQSLTNLHSMIIQPLHLKFICATSETHIAKLYNRLENHTTMESIGLGSLRRVLLSVPLDLRLASTALAFGN